MILAYIILISLGCYAILTLMALQIVLNAVCGLSKKDLKNQQEIKTKLTNIKKRQLKKK